MVLDEAARHGVHQAHVADVSVADATRPSGIVGIDQALLGHHVEHELARLEEAALRLRHRVHALGEHRGVALSRIAGGDGSHPQAQAELRRIRPEQVLADTHLLEVGPRRQCHAFADELADGFVVFVAADREAEHLLHRLREGVRGGGGVVEDLDGRDGLDVATHHVVDLGIADRAQSFQELVGEHGRWLQRGHRSSLVVAGRPGLTARAS